MKKPTTSSRFGRAARGVYESLAGVLYHGDWPAKLWSLYPGACDVRCREQRLAILPPSAASMRVGFVSDLHIGPTTPPQLLEAAFDVLARRALDVLLLGGNYVFLDATEAKAERLAGLVGRVPAARKFAVLGNHDLRTEHRVLEAALRAAGVELLENQGTQLAEGVVLIGLDEPRSGALDLASLLRDVGEPHAVLVLCHSPDGLADAQRAIAALPGNARALYLCGRTPGGQIATPWGPLPGRTRRQYPHGRHDLPPLTLYVSQGLGATDLPMRAWAPPEVAVFELTAM